MSFRHYRHFASLPINQSQFMQIQFPVPYALEALASIFERYPKFNVAAGRGSVHGGSNPIRGELDRRPLRMLKHDERDFSTCQILVVLDIFISRDDHFKPACSAASINSLFIPAARTCFLYEATCEKTSKSTRRAVIKQNQH